MKRLLIGVQARSTSTRLRDKGALSIDGKTMTARIMDEALRAKDWLSNLAEVEVALLIPDGDPLRRLGHTYEVHQGPKEDVLRRYCDAVYKYDADYVVRLTGDCAWITSQIIAKIVRDGFKYDADYCSNVLVRTFAEGFDVEMISRSMLFWLQRNVEDPENREHVTSAIPQLLKEARLPSYRIHTVMSEYDYSFLKTSIDTREEYEACCELYRTRRMKRTDAKKIGSISN